MFDKKLTAREAHKRLLVAESEMNRNLLTAEYHILTGELQNTVQPFRHAVGSFAALVDVIKSFRQEKAQSTGKKPWLVGTLFRLGVGFWQQWRPKRS